MLDNTLSIDQRKLLKFTELVNNWLLTKRMYFHPVDGELTLFMEFGAGDEPVGNGTIETFTWRALYQMAEDQGLLKL
jgi:hypothetical protein